MHIHFEGWLNYPQSFALITGNHLLDIARRAGTISATFQELPPPPAGFLRRGTAWQRHENLWSEEAQRVFGQFVPAPSSPTPTAVFRMAFPYRFTAYEDTPTFVFAVTETGHLSPGMIASGTPVQTALSGASRLITPSAWSARGLIRSGAPERSISIVPHGVDTSVFRPFDDPTSREAARTRLNWSDRFVLLNVSALYEWKGTALLLKAFAHLAAKHDDVLLALKGADDIYASRQALARASGQLSAAERDLVGPRLMYLGKTLDTHSLAECYRAADVLVAPYHAEGFNLPVLEAMASGLPVICTQGGPTDEFASGPGVRPIPSRLGPGPRPLDEWLYPDPDALFDLVLSAYGSTDFGLTEGMQSTEHVQARFTWQHATDRLVDVMTPML